MAEHAGRYREFAKFLNNNGFIVYADDHLEMYKGIGIKDLDIKLYTDARHEIINEVNREEVFIDILRWVNNHI